MATERQIQANRRNAKRSTGPTTVEGKSISRRNAMTHGHAAQTIEDVEPSEEDNARIAGLKASFALEFGPNGTYEESLIDRVAVESLRLERLGSTFFALCRRHGERAVLNWDEDRRVEAEELLGQMAKAPGLASRRLETTVQGADLKIELWNGLADHLKDDERWSEAQRTLALDLLGVHPNLRHGGRTVVDRPDQAGLARLVADEIARLGALRDGPLAESDAQDRDLAERTYGAELTRPLGLLHRYERAAIRREELALRAFRHSRRDAEAAPDPAPTADPSPGPVRMINAPRPAASDSRDQPLSTGPTALRAILDSSKPTSPPIPSDRASGPAPGPSPLPIAATNPAVPPPVVPPGPPASVSIPPRDARAREPRAAGRMSRRERRKAKAELGRSR